MLHKSVAKKCMHATCETCIFQQGNAKTVLQLFRVYNRRRLFYILVWKLSLLWLLLGSKLLSLVKSLGKNVEWAKKSNSEPSNRLTALFNRETALLQNNSSRGSTDFLTLKIGFSVLIIDSRVMFSVELKLKTDLVVTDLVISDSKLNIA